MVCEIDGVMMSVTEKRIAFGLTSPRFCCLHAEHYRLGSKDIACSLSRLKIESMAAFLS
jgi:hypothetical protein